VIPPEFQDVGLVLLGHGSGMNADSEKPVLQHADSLRARSLFPDVRAAFWKQAPYVRQVIDEMMSPRVVIVPMFISEGYFSDELIPRELGFPPASEPGAPRFKSEGARTVLYCRSLGTHSSMTSVLLGRAREVMGRFPFPVPPAPRESTLFIAGHGTPQNPRSRLAIDHQVELIRATGEWAGVHPLFMEESPRIGDCYETAATKNIVVVPFFISDGQHVCEDIPVLLGEPERIVRERLAARQPTWRNPTERKGKRVWYGRSVGTEPGIADVILELVGQSLRLIPRG
jgi:sirohydrochlorin cobaltochelatase